MMGSPKSTAYDSSTGWELRKVNSFLFSGKKSVRLLVVFLSVFLRRLLACSGWYLLALRDLVWEKGKFWDFLFSSWPRVMTEIGYCLLNSSTLKQMWWLHLSVFYRLEETLVLLPASTEIKGMKLDSIARGFADRFSGSFNEGLNLPSFT